MTDAEDVLRDRLRALATEFASLADDDQARLAFVDRIERLLAGPDLSPQSRAACHVMAAQALLGCDASGGAVVRDRLLHHLAGAEAVAAVPGLNDVTQGLRPHAFLKFGVASGPAIDAAAAVTQAVQAFDDLIGQPPGDPARVGPLAYNGALFLMEHFGPPQDDAAWDRLAGLLRLAHRQYVSTQSTAQAMDAAARFAMVAANRLARSPSGDPNRPRLFDEAWRMVDYALAGTSSAESPNAWAVNNEVAATLLAVRPGFSGADNARDAIHHLERAFLAYQDIGAREAASACAARLAQVMDGLPAPWTVNMVERREYYVRIWQESAGGTPHFGPMSLMLIANAWAKVPAADRPAGHATLRAAAEAAAAAAADAGLDAVSAASRILIGNSLLEEAGFAELNAGKLALTAAECGLLEAACDAFERAGTLAVAAGDAATEAKAARRLGAALGRRVTHCGSLGLVERGLATLRRAVTLSAGNERAAAIVNLAGLTLEAVHHGTGGSPEVVRDLVDQVRELVTASDDPHVHAAYQALTDALAAHERGGASAPDPAPEEPSASPASRRDVALRLLVAGLRGTDGSLIAQGLAHDPELLRTGAAVEGTHLSAILGQELAGSGQPVPDMRALAQALNQLLAEAQRSGVAAVVAQMGQVHDVREAQRAAFETAVSLSADVDTRRAFLRDFLGAVPDYSPERAQALYELLLLGSELELRAMEEQGVSKESDRYKAALSLVAGARVHARQTIEKDRTANSSRAAKELIMAAIGGSRTFVLLLRAFSFEGDPQPLAPEVERMTESFTKPNIGWRLLSFGERKTENIAKAARQDDMVMIVNVLDWELPQNVMKLFASNQDWQKLAFALIPEASAIILVLPTDRSLGDGVVAEIAALGRLDCLDKTVVVLDRTQDDGLADILTRRKDRDDLPAMADLPGHLRSFGFEVVLAEEDIAHDPELLGGAVRRLVDRPAG